MSPRLVPRRRVLSMLALGAALGGVVATLPGGALAVDLAQAKASGWVGERRDGYLGVIPGAPGDVQGLVDGINADRRRAYQGVASSNNVPLDQVEALAGQKLIGRAAPGEFIMDAAGRWIRK